MGTQTQHQFEIELTQTQHKMSLLPLRNRMQAVQMGYKQVAEQNFTTAVNIPSNNNSMNLNLDDPLAEMYNIAGNITPTSRNRRISDVFHDKRVEEHSKQMRNACVKIFSFGFNEF